MKTTRTYTRLLLALSTTLALSCADDDDDGDGGTTASDDGDTMSSEDGDTASSDGDDGTTGTTEDGGEEDGGSTGPYGRCETEADCPVEGSRCPGSSKSCLPPCSEASDCPELAGFEVTCEGETCSIPCSVSSPCPEGMTCFAGIACGWP